MSNRKKSLAFIQNYLHKNVVASLDGSIFSHKPATFHFQFADPSELWETIMDEYSDYLEEWDEENIIPVAEVSAEGSRDYKFAYIFLDWRAGEQPAIVVTTTDRWDPDYSLASIEELMLQIK